MGTRYAVGDLTTVVHISGSGEPAFVLVHGIAVSSRYFERTTAELAKLGTVYALDLPGYGESPKPGRDVSIADHARVVRGFIEQAGLSNPTLVGHSMGCQVVSLLAARGEQVSDRLVLMAPTMPANERSLFSGAWRLLLDSIRNPIRADFVIVHDYLFRCGIPYFLAQRKHLFGDRIETRLADITAKTLVINGNRDIVVPRSWARRISDGIADSRLELVKGPHVTMYTDPVRVAALIGEHAAR